MLFRRRLCHASVLVSVALLAACAPVAPLPVTPAVPSLNGSEDAARYTSLTDETFNVPAVSLDHLDQRLRRQEVVDPTGERPGTIVVDPGQRLLYLVEADGKAIRYGVGVGKEGMAWSGTANIAFKREWPRWTPTGDMIAREPQKYGKWSSGMAGGPSNPLGARAMYLFEDGKDTLYRIHGTNDPGSIGKAMSSGCIRMINQDVMDLYRRVSPGARVVVLPVVAARLG